MPIRIAGGSSATRMSTCLGAALSRTLILLDWMMPRCSSDEFRRRQLANAKTADVPVVVISAAAEREDVFRDLSPSAIVTKPFQLEDLLDIVTARLQPPR